MPGKVRLGARLRGCQLPSRQAAIVGNKWLTVPADLSAQCGFFRSFFACGCLKHVADMQKTLKKEFAFSFHIFKKE